MRVDQSRQRLDIGGFADVPVMQMRELAQGGRLAGIRHARQAEIDAVRQNHGEKRIAIIGRSTGASMREAFGKAGPAIDLQQQISDLHAGQAIVDHAPHVLRIGRGYCLERRDDEPAVFGGAAVLCVFGLVAELDQAMPWYEYLWAAYALAWVPWLLGIRAAVIDQETTAGD